MVTALPMGSRKTPDTPMQPFHSHSSCFTPSIESLCVCREPELDEARSTTLCKLGDVTSLLPEWMPFQPCLHLHILPLKITNSSGDQISFCMKYTDKSRCIQTIKVSIAQSSSRPDLLQYLLDHAAMLSWHQESTKTKDVHHAEFLFLLSLQLSKSAINYL